MPSAIFFRNPAYTHGTTIKNKTTYLPSGVYSEKVQKSARYLPYIQEAQIVAKELKGISLRNFGFKWVEEES